MNLFCSSGRRDKGCRDKDNRKMTRLNNKALSRVLAYLIGLFTGV